MPHQRTGSVLCTTSGRTSGGPSGDGACCIALDLARCCGPRSQQRILKGGSLSTGEHDTGNYTFSCFLEVLEPSWAGMVRLEPVDFFPLDVPVRNHRRRHILTAQPILRITTAITRSGGSLWSSSGVSGVGVESQNVLLSSCEERRDQNEGQMPDIVNSPHGCELEECIWLVGGLLYISFRRNN